MKIYIAGALSGNNAIDYVNNMRAMLQTAHEVVKKGHIPYVPCLDFLIGITAENNWTIEEYYKFNIVWVECCDALLIISHSKGADAELELAIKLGKKIFRNIGEIPSV